MRCFGGGGSSTKMYDPLAGTGVRGLYQQLNQMLTPQIGQGITPYAGQTVAGVSPLQQQGFGLATGLSPLVTGSQQYYQDVLGQQAAGGYPIQQLAGRTLESLMQPYDEGGARDYWQQAFVNPAMQTWREQVAPQIMETYGAGGVGGALGQQLGRSGQELMTNLGGQLANILYSGQQAQLGRQQTGVNQAMGLAQLPGQIVGQAGQIGGQGMDILSQLLGYGGQQRDISQQQLGGAQQQWQQAQPWANPYLQNYLGTALSQPGMQMVSQEQGPGLASLLGPLGSLLGTETGAGMLRSGLGGLGGLLGFGGAGVGAGAAGFGAPLAGGSAEGLAMLSMLMASDVRLKENFAKIENAVEKVEHLEGLTFDFKEAKNRSAGLVAQDVEKILPEAVGETLGYKFINYGAVIALLVNAIKELNRKVEVIQNG